MREHDTSPISRRNTHNTKPNDTGPNVTVSILRASTRCLLMHTGALFRTSDQLKPTTACRWLRTCCIAIFLATFLLTLLSIIVSDMMCYNKT